MRWRQTCETGPEAATDAGDGLCSMVSAPCNGAPCYAILLKEGLSTFRGLTHALVACPAQVEHLITPRAKLRTQDELQTVTRSGLAWQGWR